MGSFSQNDDQQLSYINDEQEELTYSRRALPLKRTRETTFTQEEEERSDFEERAMIRAQIAQDSAEIERLYAEISESEILGIYDIPILRTQFENLLVNRRRLTSLLNTKPDSTGSVRQPPSKKLKTQQQQQQQQPNQLGTKQPPPRVSKPSMIRLA